jgi:hypothetical protein
MKIRIVIMAILLVIGANPVAVRATERPLVETFTFTPNDLDLISANTTIIFEMVVSHPNGIKNTSTLATLVGPNGSTLATYLTRTDSPLNLGLSKVTFKGSLTLPQSITAGAYSVTVAEINNNSTAGYEYGTGVVTSKKLRNLIGAEYSLLIRNSGELNLNYDTFVGPTHNTTLGISYNNPLVYNNDNPPIWKVGETYVPAKYYESRIPSLPLVVSSSTPNICSVDGNNLKLIASGNCTFKISTTKTKDYAAKEILQVVTITAARSKPELVMSVIASQTAKSLPKTIEIFRVFSPTGVYVLPKTTTPTTCIPSGFYVQIVGGGTCTLTYQSEANSSYLESDMYKVSFEVTRDPQTITFTPVTTVDIAAKSLMLSASASSGGVITFTTPSIDICSVFGSTLNLIDNGNCVVVATQAGTTSLAPVSATATILLTRVSDASKPVLAKRVIICLKGSTTKKISQTSPKCPKGYKLKK